MTRMRYAYLFLALLLIALPLFAESPITGSVRVRVENWQWFETPDADDGYTFLGAQLRLAAKRKLGSVEGQLEIAAPVLWNLPERAALAAPRGQLGLGGAYFQANGDTDAAAVFVKQAFLRAGGLRIGRFEFADGSEHVPADAQLAALRRDHIAHRLIGTFAFSHVGRSLDGVQFDARNWTLLAARPTAGVFRVHGGRNLDVDLLYASWVRSTASSDARLFAIGYRDEREVVKTDNRSAAARAADREPIKIGTLGGHYIARRGIANALVWGASQWGDWGSLRHRAFAFDAEAGVQLAKTSVRAGWYRSSGDADPADGDHRTFFQLLPTPRFYARFPFYNAMNSNDAFVQVGAKPHAKLSLQSEIHRLALSSKRDLWYAGGGAYDDNAFGYAGRPASGRNGLATVVDLSADYKPNANTSVTFYVARAFGGEVVKSIFEGDSATFGYVEVVKRF
ncbi:MAG TPA: alginate export family protein [Thermoanaerobaculia bacterium]|nr:alginate export family protein [Thermoanaerobaculia bacterium]